MADAAASNTVALKACGFDSHLDYSSVVQLVGRLPSKQVIAGSTPVWGTKWL